MSRRFVLSWLNYSLETTAAANAQVVQSHKRHQSFAQLTFQSMDLTKTTAATIVTYTEKNGMKQSGFVGTVGTFCHNWTEEDRFYIYHNMYP